MPAAIVHLHDRQASCAPARRVPSVPPDAYARGDATLRPRLALQVFLTMAAAKTPERLGHSVQTGDGSEAPESTEQSVSIDSRRGTGSAAASSSSSSRAPPTRTRGDDTALQAAWAAIGRGEEYAGPDDREEADLDDRHNRRRGETARKKRLERGWKRVERARKEAKAEDADMEPLASLSSLAVTEQPPLPQPSPPPLPPPPPPQPLPVLTEGSWAVTTAKAERLAAEIAATEGEAAVDAYHGVDLPVSPLGRFESRSLLLEHHNIPAPLDEATYDEEWDISGSEHGATVAWVKRTDAFCCVGHRARVGSELGRLPHNVAASPAAPQWALAHVVEWTLRSMHHVDVHVTPAVHCDSCAQMLLALQAHVPAAPLFTSPVSVDVLRAEMWAWHARCGAPVAAATDRPPAA